MAGLIYPAALTGLPGSFKCIVHLQTPAGGILNNIYTLVQLNAAARYDPHDMCNFSNHRITMKEAGRYRIMTTITFSDYSPSDESNGNTSGGRVLTVTGNTDGTYDGSNIRCQEYTAAAPDWDSGATPTSAHTVMTTIGYIQASVNDRLQVWAWQNSGKSLNFYQGYPGCTIAIERIDDGT